MSVLNYYFVRGLDVDEIVAEIGLPREEIVSDLRSSGVGLAGNSKVDAVTAALKKHGYLSFHDFVMQHGFLVPIKDQARHLGVSRYVLAKLYDAYRRFISESTPGGRAGSDQDETS